VDVKRNLFETIWKQSAPAQEIFDNLKNQVPLKLQPSTEAK